ncbi:Molybdopterin-synthase adenylyltransferase [bacterium HR40]|nr:Molybdopterin-synthase adenylyltransferase [bacterium HR40]
MASKLDEAAIRRWARQIVLPEVGGQGQARLLAARVLVVGAGGLGSPLLLYLAAAGVGCLGIVDSDRVDVSNLHRQLLFDESDIGRPKAEAAAARLARLVSGIEVRPFAQRLDSGNCLEILRGWDVVADGSDNFATRRTVHDACFQLRIPLVSASVQGMDGQLTTFVAWRGRPHPCFHCLFPEEPEAGALPSCAQGGVLGPAAGVIGCLQAVEVVKELVGGLPGLSGQLVIYDARSCAFRTLRVRRRPGCPVCGG